MADRLSRMYGTEEDKVNCPFYYKIGACRHGDRCSRAHNKPLFSQTVCLKTMYVNPMASVVTGGGRLTKEQEKLIQDQFEDFYCDVYDEMGKYGEVDDILVCDNLSDHLIGNVYVKYNSEEDAAAALQAVNGRWYSGRQLAAEYSPVTEFREARCRQFDEQGCNRGPFCNFMHVKYLARDMKEDLFGSQPGHNNSGGGGGKRDPNPRDDRRGSGEPPDSRRRSRSRSPPRGGGDRGGAYRGGGDAGGRGRDGGGDRGARRSRSRDRGDRGERSGGGGGRW